MLTAVNKPTGARSMVLTVGVAAMSVMMFAIPNTERADQTSGLIVKAVANAAACDELNFTSVSSQQWQCFKEAVALQHQVKFSGGNAGQASITGGSVNYTFDPTRRTLKLSTSRSWWNFESCSTINGRISEFLTDCKGPQVTRLRSDQQHVEIWQILRPNVKRPDTPYNDIVFRAGDRVRIEAGGCVQTGGGGDTWRDYLDPIGPKADRFYHGLITLPGKAPLRIREFITRGNNEQITAGSDMRLHLGYEDENGQYANNGYWGKDKGWGGQCVNKREAQVTIMIHHQSR